MIGSLCDRWVGRKNGFLNSCDQKWDVGSRKVATRISLSNFGPTYSHLTVSLTASLPSLFGIKDHLNFRF